MNIKFVKMYANTKSFVILLILCSGYLQNAGCYPWQQQPEEDSCSSNLTCLPISKCSINGDETTFPCGQHETEVKVCCSPVDIVGDRNGAQTTLKASSTTPKTSPTKTSSPTTAKATTKPYIPFTEDTAWSGIPVSLEDKVSLLPKNCGRSLISNRIINGMDADFGQFPWMALLGRRDPETNAPIFFCGGSLINNRYVLTAAHCLGPKSIPTFVRLGEWNIDTDNDCVKTSTGEDDCADPVMDVEIEKYIMHDKYGNANNPSYRYDIGLIRLTTEVTFTDFITPICLSNKKHRNVNHRYTVAGWGVTDNDSSKPSSILQFIQIKLFDFLECNSVAPTDVSPLQQSSQFCAGGVNEQDACRGDSGGPLIYNLHNKEYQKGIVSFATSETCARDARPTVFTEVTSFINWILKTIEK